MNFPRALVYFYNIANYFSIGKPFFHYSNSNMLNSKALLRYATEKTSALCDICNQINSFKF